MSDSDAEHKEAFARYLKNLAHVEEIKKRSNRAAKLANFVAASAASAGVIAALSAFYSDSDIGVGKTDTEMTFQLERNIAELAKQINSRIAVVEEAATSLGGEELSGALTATKARDNSKRLDAVEALLDMQPRQLIEITKLRDEIDDMRSEVAARQLQTVRELDRAYNLILALVGSLLVAVVSMVIANFLRRKQD